MSQHFVFDEKNVFLNKLRELLKSGVPQKNISVITPYHVHEVDEILVSAPSKLRIFTFAGALLGGIAGFAFPIYTTLSWKINVGGKPVVSIPAFVIIAFELTILFGALATFFGFLLFSKLPVLKQIIDPVDYDKQFVILVKNGEK